MPPAIAAFSFTSSLPRGPGIAWNAGYNEFGTKPDLAFVEASQKRSDAAYFKPSGVTLAWTIPGGGDSGNAIEVSWGNTAPTQFLLYVDSYDYASVEKINARMYAGPDKRNPGQKKYVSAECMLPKSDDSAPYIASRVKQIERGWLQWNGATGEDAESGPGINANPGDRLTAFEEYRGFKIKDTHERTSPLQKDIFVHSQFNNRVIGIGTAANLPAPFKVWLVDADEMENFKDGANNPDKTINFLVCEDYHVLNQSALWFRPGGTMGGTLQDPTEKHFGFTFPGHLDGPVSIEWCKIYEGSIKAEVTRLINKLKKAIDRGILSRPSEFAMLKYRTENRCIHPCKHSYSSGGNHNYIRCPSRWNGYQCTGYRYECRSHIHTYPRVRPCGHSYSSGGNHTRVTCPRNAAGDACSSGNYYVCRSHTHAYPARRPCGHLQSDSRNHTYGRCTTRQNGAQCTGSRYACKTHTHTYRRPCGHLQSASGNHSYGRCTTTRNGQRCTGSRYACKTHTHTYPTSSGNNSSGNNSSGNNSSGNNSSGNNSSGNNSSGNNSSGVRCGNTARGTSACSSGGYASTRTSHRARCRRGHTYWGCNPNAVRWHSRH